MKKEADLFRTVTAVGLAVMFFVPALSAGDDKPSIIVFDVPGAGTGAGQGTIPYASNAGGAITGVWIDASGVSHGFVRHPNGSIVSFDGPEAVFLTQGEAINNEGFIAGNYVDGNHVGHGLLRAPDGTVISFDAP